MAGGRGDADGTRALVPGGRLGDKSAAMLLAPLHQAIAFALPPRCPGCGTPVGEPHRFCATCWGSLRFLGPPWCATCHAPFAFDRGEGAQCGRCLAAPPRHDGVRAAVAYGDVARTVALKLKYGGRIGLAETIARQLVRHVPDDTDAFVAVPLHRWRLWSRGFNQAVLIARALAALSVRSFDPATLIRTRRTPVLRGLGHDGRRRALTGSIRVADAARARVRGRSLVLVDDVHTSGATADACTRALRGAGAAKVTILCWARVVAADEGEPDWND